MRASSAVPGVFTPVAVAGREFVDGGLVAPVPVGQARAMGAEVVLAVDISSDPEGKALTYAWQSNCGDGVNFSSAGFDSASAISPNLTIPSTSFTLYDGSRNVLAQKAITQSTVPGNGWYNLDLDTWGRRGGVIVESPDTVGEAVRTSLAEPDRHSEIRQAMAKDLFFNPGRATPRALEWFHHEFGLTGAPR